MKKRPVSITLLSWFFIMFGIAAVIASTVNARKNGADEAGNFTAENFAQFVLFPIVINALAILAGAFTLLGHNWARYFLVAWLGFHVLLSFVHSPSQVIAHTAFLIVAAFIFFRPPASVFFRRQIVPLIKTQ
jgi:hypothetical protein